MNETVEQDGARAVIYRDAPEWEGARTAAIGKLRLPDADSGAALLRDIASHLRGEGFTRLIGPMEGNTWSSYRLVSETDGSPAFLMEPTSGDHDRSAFAAAGFTPIARYFSARAAIADAIGTAPDPDPAITIRAWDGSDPEGYFAKIHALSTQAFAGNAFYTPLALEPFLAMYMPFVPMLKPGLIFLAEDAGCGDLLGFLFGIPNYGAGPDPETVILKTYAGLRPGVGHRLAHAFHTAALEAGYTSVIHALIHDDNRSATRSRQHGAAIFRRYELMGLRLDD